MDTLAALIYSLFTQSCREHPAPPLMEKLKLFLQQRKLLQADRKSLPPALRNSSDRDMISKEKE